MSIIMKKEIRDKHWHEFIKKEKKSYAITFF